MAQVIVGIDIGTSKVCTTIGTVDKSNQVEVLGLGIEPCNGVKKGVVVDIESTSKAIKASATQAEKMAGLKVGSAYVNIQGTHVSIINNKNSINISADSSEISTSDVERVLTSVKNVSIPKDSQVIDVIPRQYIIDGYDEILEPVGMVGVKLEVDADIIAAKITSTRNLVKSMEKAEIMVDGIVLEALATGEMVLTPEERDMGVILIDVGGGITDISIFKNRKLVFYDSIPVGGDHITNDISIGLKIPYAEAEKIKKEYELALTSLIKNDYEFQVTDINENKKKTIRVSEVVEIIEARVFEIFSLSKELIQKSLVNENSLAGVVLNGGGISYIDGSMQLANEVFEIPVRVVSQRPIGVSKLEYITSLGIVKYLFNNCKGDDFGSEVKIIKHKTPTKETGFFKKLSKKFYDFFFTL